MIDLYYWPTSNGRKITIMLHEVELPYTIIPVNFKIGEQYAPDYLAINPNSKIPAIVDRDPIGGGAPITVFELVAILIYLAEKSGQLMPSDARGRYDVMKWAVFQAASIGPMFGQMAYFHDYAEPNMPAALARYETRCAGSTRCWSAASARPSISRAITRSPTSRSGRGSSRRGRSSGSRTIRI